MGHGLKVAQYWLRYEVRDDAIVASIDRGRRRWPEPGSKGSMGPRDDLAVRWFFNPGATNRRSLPPYGLKTTQGLGCATHWIAGRPASLRTETLTFRPRWSLAAPNQEPARGTDCSERRAIATALADKRALLYHPIGGAAISRPTASALRDERLDAPQRSERSSLRMGGAPR